MSTEKETDIKFKRDSIIQSDTKNWKLTIIDAKQGFGVIIYNTSKDETNIEHWPPLYWFIEDISGNAQNWLQFIEDYKESMSITHVRDYVAYKHQLNYINIMTNLMNSLNSLQSKSEKIEKREFTDEEIFGELPDYYVALFSKENKWAVEIKYCNSEYVPERCMAYVYDLSCSDCDEDEWIDKYGHFYKHILNDGVLIKTFPLKNFAEHKERICKHRDTFTSLMMGQILSILSHFSNGEYDLEI